MSGWILKEKGYRYRKGAGGDQNSLATDPLALHMLGSNKKRLCRLVRFYHIQKLFAVAQECSPAIPIEAKVR